jgi:hypothetical protein
VRDQNPIKTARRKARQKEREELGVAIPPCILCVHDHHTAGQNHDPLLTDQVCERHHRELHEQLLQGGVSLRFERDPIKRAVLSLQAIATYDIARAGALQRLAALLSEHLEDVNEPKDKTQERQQ